MKRADLTQSDYICKCCEPGIHAGSEEHELLPDDVACENCGALCACKCHRKTVKEDESESSSPFPVVEDEEEPA